MPENNARPVNTPRQVLFASLIGTTIEFFDFYIYATAAVLVFPRLFFPASDPASATLASLATFAIAFLARPLGSALFGHFGDRIGRKATLVAALLTMGVSTVAIGLLPTYASIGIAAPLLLALCRFGQGLGLGGEWGGAVLLAVENAPPGKRAWYGMFPQLGAPLGFFFSGSVFLLLSRLLSDDQFFRFGWRIPFLASAALVVVGLYVRLTITETPIFRNAVHRSGRVKVPMVVVFRDHFGTLIVGVLASLATFVLFYLMTVFALSWGTTALGYRRETFLLLQLFGVVCFALAIPVSAILAERSRRGTLLGVSAAIAVFGLVMAPMLTAGTLGAGLALAIGLSLMGADVWPARHRAVGAVPHGRALHRQLADLQPGGHLRGVARSLRGDVAGDQLRVAVRRLLPDRVSVADDRGVAGDPRDARSGASLSRIRRRSLPRAFNRRR